MKKGGGVGFFGALAVVVIFLILRGDMLSPEAWKARGDYEIASASADAVRAQTTLLTVLMRWQSAITTLLILLIVAISVGLVVVFGMFIYKRYLAEIPYPSPENKAKVMEDAERDDVVIDAAPHREG